MAGVWRKTLMYLGLVEDDELEEIAPGEQTSPVQPTPRRPSRSEPVVLTQQASGPESTVRTIAQPRKASAGTIHRAEPKRFNEARDLGEKFKDGVPVIMNLQQTEDSIARRLVDFASGLVFGLDGKIELVATRVYLLTPSEVEVSAEERERLRDTGFFNQY
ncbi:MAG TPA: cell division protein SepF [Actinomycetota bacterium]